MRLTVPIQLRWGDQDAYGHVNNATMLQLLEEARVRGLWENGRHATDGVWTLIARQEIEYLLPLPYGLEPVPVEMWVSNVGGSSIEVGYEIHAPEDAEDAAGREGTVYARAATVIVFVDAGTGRPKRLEEEDKARWLPYLGEPVPFRRSGATRG